MNMNQRFYAKLIDFMGRKFLPPLKYTSMRHFDYWRQNLKARWGMIGISMPNNIGETTVLSNC